MKEKLQVQKILFLKIITNLKEVKQSWYKTKLNKKNRQKVKDRYYRAGLTIDITKMRNH